MSALIGLFGVAASEAAVLSVPSPEFNNVLSAHIAASDGDTIAIQAGLYLEVPPVLFSANKNVILQPTNGRVILTSITPPANDDFAGRIGFGDTSISLQAFNYSATTRTDDCPPGSLQCDAVRFRKTLWWAWTAPTTGLAVVNTVGSDFPAAVEVFVGTGYPPGPLPEEDRVWFLRNEIAFRAQAGITYPILIGGEDGAYGQAVLNLFMPTPPANDDCTNALSLAGAGVEVRGSTYAATRELPEADHAGRAAGHSVWFRWSAPTNESYSAHPAAISTAGSDFDTVLAVYTTNDVPGLALVASNDDRAALEYESRVSFNPTSGQTYWIALDGSTKGIPQRSVREMLGNYQLRIDYSLVNLRIASLQTATNGQSVSFAGELLVRNFGLAPTAPLQVRLVARPGRNLAGIHLASASTETDLGTVEVPPGEGLASGGGNTPFLVSSVCPAPVILPDGQTNIWGVFAILEEQFGGWAPIDSEFLLYGYVPETGGPVLSYGIGRPVPSALAASELNDVLWSTIHLTNYVTDDSSNHLFMLVQLTTGDARTITNAVWSGSFSTNSTLFTNGRLIVGALSYSTSITVTGRFTFSGAPFSPRPDTVPIYLRPSLAMNSSAAPGFARLDLRGDAGSRYALDVASSFSATNSQTGWQTIQTFLLTNSLATLTNVLITPERQQFYRVRLQP